MNILFLGSGNLGIRCLRQLLAWNENVIQVICRTEEKSACKTPFPSLKAYAVGNGLPVSQPKDVNNRQFLTHLFRNKIDLIISALYNQILKKELLRIPRKGSINIHLALLPKYRGCFPIPWAIIEGKETGVTLHWINEGIDTGDIIAQKKIPITRSDTAKKLYNKAVAKGAALFGKYFPLIAKGTAPLLRQNEKKSSYHPRGYPFKRIIDWSWSAHRIDCFVRAFTFPPFPSARTYLGNHEIEIMHPVRINSSRNTGIKKSMCPGYIETINNSSVQIVCGKGRLSIYKVRLSNKKIVAASSLTKIFGMKTGSVFKII